MDIFTNIDYRQVIRDKSKENGEIRGYQSAMAKAAGCQRSYFSQVLSGHVQLTPDHGIGLAQFWNLTPPETEFFLDLIHLDRAGTKDLKEYFKARIKQQQVSRNDLGKRFQSKSLTKQDDQGAYYSSWIHGAVHILTSIPEFQRPEAIGNRLQIPLPMVIRSLELLGELGLVEQVKQGRYTPKSYNIHLGRNSSLTAVNHAQWRQKANLNLLMNHDLSVHYTALHSLSLEDFQRLREMIFSLIENSRSLIASSKEEELVCFALDFFRV